MKHLAVLLWASGVLLAAGTAEAALTDSEQQQVVSTVRAGEVGRAERVRALIARPDLTPDESAGPLVAAYSTVAFDAARARFTQELLYGPGSAPSRGVLAEAVVSALLGRADTVIAQLPAGQNPAFSSAASKVADELVLLHGFVAEHIANAGSPPEDGHDASVNIRDDTLERAVRLYARHFERHSSWLRLDRAAKGSWVRARSQAALTLVSLARGVLPRHEVGAMLGLAGARRAAFERHGFLLEDGGAPSEALREALIERLDAAPLAARGLALFVVGKVPVTGLSARGSVARAGCDPTSAAERRGLLPPEVEPAPVSAHAAEIAHAVAFRATRAAFKQEPALDKLARAVTERVRRAGEAGLLTPELGAMLLAGPAPRETELLGLSAEQVVAHAVRLVLLDAERATTIALARSVAGRDEPLATLVVALSVLAAQSPGADALRVGALAEGGSSRPVALPVSAEGGVVRAFGAAKARREVVLDSDGRVTRVALAGKPPALLGLPFVRLTPVAAEEWTAGATRFRKLFGAPRGLGIGDGRFVLASAEQSHGFDAAVTGEPQRDATVTAKLAVEGPGGGLLLRATPGQSSYHGVALFVSAEPRRALLVQVDGQGRAVELAAPVELDVRPSYDVELSVVGSRVTARVDKKRLEATLSAPPPAGRAGLAARAGGRVTVREFKTSQGKRGPR